MHKVSPAVVPDLRKLHPRGDERFQKGELEVQWQAQLHHNALVSAIRDDLVVPTEDAAEAA